MKILLVLSVLAISVTLPDTGEAQYLVPGDNMMLDGIPSIPATIARDAGRYGQYRSASFARWHPVRLEMLIRTRFGNTSQVHRVAAPGAFREQLTFFDEPVGSLSAYEANGPSGDFFTFVRDVGGGEFYQLYRYDVANGQSPTMARLSARTGRGSM